MDLSIELIRVLSDPAIFRIRVLVKQVGAARCSLWRQLNMKRAARSDADHCERLCVCRQDEEKDVMRAAEECAETLANSINPEQCVNVLNPIIQTADYPVNLAAIKMQTKVRAQGRAPSCP